MAKKLTDQTIVDVINNSTGAVGLMIDERTTKVWALPNENKRLKLSELKQAIDLAGGFTIINDYLLIRDPEIRLELDLPISEEYLMGSKEIAELLTKTPSEIDHVLCDANENIKEKIAKEAIDQKLGDLDKIEIIEKHSGIKVLSAIQEKKEDDKEKAKTN